MAVAAKITHGMRVSEEIASGGTAVPSTAKALIHDQYNTEVILSTGSTPAVSATASFLVTLSSGAATIDLTALTGLNSATVNGTNLQVRAIKFRSPSSNANVITVKKGASNGYQIGMADGANAFNVSIPPGGDFSCYLAANGVVISSSAKTLDVSGTGSQTLECQVVMG